MNAGLPPPEPDEDWLLSCGVKTTFNPPVGVPSSATSSNAAWLYQVPFTFADILQVFPAGDLGLIGATKLGLLSPWCLSALGIDTSIFEHDEYYIAKTKIVAYDPERVLATGHYKQFKKKNGSYLQGALPMAESFSISRALSFFGILDSDITSKEEYDALNIPTTKGTKDTHQMMSVPIDKIVDEIKKAPHITRLKHLRNVKYAECFDLAIKKHPAVYKDLDNVYRIKLDNINRQEKI